MSKTELVPAPALAQEFGIHRRSLTRWLVDRSLGLPEPVKIRGRLFFKREEVEAWKAEQIRAVRTEKGGKGADAAKA